MTRARPNSISIIRRLRPSPDRLAAASALQDPNLLLHLQAAHADGEQRTTPRPSRAPRPSPIRGALAGETGGALLLVAGVALALLWSDSPWHASYAAFCTPRSR